MEKMEKPVSNSPFSPFYAIGPPPPPPPLQGARLKIARAIQLHISADL